MAADPTDPDSRAPGEPRRGISRRAAAGLVAGPLLFLVMLLAPPPAALSHAGWRCAGVGVLMAIWWITEAVPIPATALLPIVLFPTLGIAKLGDTTAPYANPVIFLFMGGFLIARAMQRWGLHRRIALNIIRVVGTRPSNMIGGFMLASAFLSMWVSNTATVAMLYPIGLSVIELMIGRDGEPHPDAAPVSTALMLGIAYAASIGGIATLIGTPPNALLAGYMAEAYGVRLDFARWMLVGIPLVVLMLPLCWILLTRIAFRSRLREIPGGAEMVAGEIRAMGRPGRGEALTAAVFGLAAVAWVFRPVLARWIPGLSDAGIAIAGGLLLFLLPADPRRGEFVLDWPSAAKLPWGVLLLFGGGLSLAAAISETGLAHWIGASMSGAGVLPDVLLMLVVTLVMMVVTELTSNTASTATFLPIVAPLAVALGHDPLLLAVPAVVAASCAFMLPVATPPNAIVFASGHVTIPQMARAGVLLDVIFSVVVVVVLRVLLPVVFGTPA